MNKIKRSALLMCFLLVVACGRQEDISSSTSIASPSQANGEKNDASAIATSSAFISNAISHIDRMPEDSLADIRRKPSEALAFFKVKPGQTIFEIEAGSGYYTELLSRTVGPDGTVIMHNHEQFNDYIGEDVKARLASNRLKNVKRVISSFDTLKADDNSIDVVTWILGPHELYFMPAPEISLGDPELTFQEITRILKPGGVFVTIDHSAGANAPTSTGNALHRIDKQHVIALAEAAGLVLEEESRFLANTNDSLDTNIFDPAIRGKTDRFSLRFIKPIP